VLRLPHAGLCLKARCFVVESKIMKLSGCQNRSIQDFWDGKFLAIQEHLPPKFAKNCFWFGIMIPNHKPVDDLNERHTQRCGNDDVST